MFSFAPEYFSRTKDSVSSFIVDNCIKTFTFKIDTNQRILKKYPHLLIYDSKFIHELLQTSQKSMSTMEMIAVLFDFTDVLHIPIAKDTPILLAVRKLYALSFYITQLTRKGENTQPFTEIRKIFEMVHHKLSSLSSSSTSEEERANLHAHVTGVVAACAFALSMFFSRCSQIITILDDNFYSVVLCALKIAELPITLDEDSTPYFVTFFLSSILTFPKDINLTDNYKELLLSLIETSLKYCSKYDVSSSFNFPSLCYRMISFFENPTFPNDTKTVIYTFIASISYQNETLSSFLFDEENLKLYTSFLVTTMNSIDSEMNYTKTNSKIYEGVKRANIEFDEILSDDTFGSIFSPISIEETQYDRKSQFLADPNLSLLFESTFSLCNSNPDNRLLAHSTFLLAFLKMKVFKPTVLIFVMIWFKKFISMDPDEAFKSFGNTKVVRQFLHLSSSSSFINLAEYQHNLYDTLAFMSKNCQYDNFLEEVFNKFEIDSLQLSLDYEYVDCIMKCIKVAEQKVLSQMKNVNFDARLSNIIITLRSYHECKENNEEVLKAIGETRTIVFYFLNRLLEVPLVKYYFAHSESYIFTICQLIFEKDVSNYAFELIGQTVQNLRSSDSQLNMIFSFFQTQMSKTNDPQYVNLGHTILDNVVQYFSLNPTECGIVFLQTRLLTTLANFVASTKLNDDLSNLFRIFQYVSSIQDQVMEYLIESNLFDSLGQLLETQFTNEDIRDQLWSIAVDTKCKFLDQPRIIKNAAPLSLLIRGMKSSKDSLIDFIKFIRSCCEKNVANNFSALQVNDSKIPSFLIGIIQEYRKKDESDELFDECLNLLSIISKNFMKSKDLLALFQTLTLLPGKNVRPFFTIQILKTLITIFNTNRQDPTSFLMYDISLSRYCLIQFPDIPLKYTFANFSLIFSVKFEKFKPKSKCDLLSLKTMPDITMNIYFVNNKLYFVFQKGNLVFERNVPVMIELDKWIQIAFVVNNQNLVVYFDEENVFEVKIPLVEFSQSISSGYFIKNIRCCFYSFFLLSCSLDQQFIRLLSQMPRISSTSFRQSEIDEFPHVYRPLFNNKIASHAIFIYNATSIYENILPNLATEYPSYPAKFFGTSFNYLPQPKFVLHCIGGIPTFYPLFSQLDQPFSPELLPTIISVLTALFTNCAVNQEEFAQSHGFQIISYLINCSKLANISKEFIEKLIELFNSIDYIPLIRQMFFFLFLDIQLWIYLPIEDQIYFYNSVITLFDNMSPDDKKKLVTVLHFRDIVMLMRVCLWSKKISPLICLIDKPKIDLTTKQVEAERPSDVSEIRKVLWEFAFRVADVLMTRRDVETICLYSFETRDLELCFETIEMLIKLIQSRNQVVIENLKLFFTFKEFIPLLLTNDERLRIYCIHIFMQCTSPDISFLLAPSNQQETVNLMCQYINNKNMTTNFANVIFGYLFGLEQPSFERITYKKEEIKHFNIDDYAVVNNSDLPMFKNEFLLPLAFGVISDLPNNFSIAYASLLDKVFNTCYNDSSSNLSNNDDLIQHLLFLLISRISENKGKCDETTNIILNLFVSFYVDLILKEKSNHVLDHVRMMIVYFSLNLNTDLNYIYSMILNNVTQRFIMLENVDHSIISSFVTTIFDCLFNISETDEYYLPPFGQSNDQSQETSKEQISYQRIARIMSLSPRTNMNFTFASRTTIDGEWIDSKLAILICNLFKIYPFLGNTENNLYILSFTLGVGLAHPESFDIFSLYIELLTEFIPTITNAKYPESMITVLINYFGGLIRIYFNTNSKHRSHQYLYQDTKTFSPILLEYFKLPSNTFNWLFIDNSGGVEGFDNFIMNDKKGQNYLYQIIEKYSFNLDSNILNNKLKTSIKEFLDFLGQRKTYQRPKAPEEILRRNQYLIGQLRRFALDVKHGKSKGFKSYVEIWRTLSGEREPWMQPEITYIHHWKLPNIVQDHLKRGLMLENFKFNDHKEASLLRDVGNPRNATEEYKQHLKKMRITNFTGNNPVLTLMTDIEESEADSKENDKTRRRNDDIILTVDAKHVTMKDVSSGTFMLTNKNVIFDSDKYIEINLDTLTAIFLRRYLLFDTSIEIFTSDHRSYFFDFVEGQRDKVMFELVKMKKKGSMTNLKFIQDSEKSINNLIASIQDKWIDGRISNFEYLMTLNMIAGRTYNDLSQYPVFPWILSDYTSNEIDLKNPNVYRDLSCPIGAYSKERLLSILERVTSAQSKSDYYLYGSFYSSAAVVIGYMIRVEPFTSFHIKLQSGRFDLPERLFRSIPRTWNSVNTLQMDFRELIPEFFYFPDFLVNSNHFDLGKNTNDVELPPWAKTPREFIQINRAALESPIVSQNLPRWIDMIFGITSRGEQALKISNVFNPLYFDDGILEDVNGDENRKLFRTEFAACFGQAPHQIFKKKNHPERAVVERILKPREMRMVFNCKSRPILTLEISEKRINEDQNNAAKGRKSFGSITTNSIASNARSPSQSSLKDYNNNNNNNNTPQSPQQQSTTNTTTTNTNAINTPQSPTNMNNTESSNLNPANLSNLNSEVDNYHLVNSTSISSFTSESAADGDAPPPLYHIELTSTNLDGVIFIYDSEGNNFQEVKLPPLFGVDMIHEEDLNSMPKLIKTKSNTILQASLCDSSFSLGVLRHISSYAQNTLNKIRNLPPAAPMMRVNEIFTPINSSAANGNNNNNSANSITINTNENAVKNSTPIPSSMESFQLPSSISDSSLHRAVSSVGASIGQTQLPQMMVSPANLGFISRIKRRSRASCISNENSNLLLYELKHVKRINARKVSCLAITEHRYVTGSLDNTVIVWTNELDKSQIPLSILSKHKSSVNSIDANEKCNILVSAARDGSIVTASLMTGKFIKLISVINVGDPINVKISDNGTICVCFLQADKSLVKVYDINLNELAEHLFESKISALSLFDWYNQTEYLAIGMKNRTVAIYSIPEFKLIWSVEKNDWEASVIEVAPLSKVMFFGSLSGKVFSIKLEDEDQTKYNNYKLRRKYTGPQLVPFDSLILSDEVVCVNQGAESELTISPNEIVPETSSNFESAPF